MSPPRSGRGRCTGPRPPSARRPPRPLALRWRLARSRSRSARRPRLPRLAGPEPQQGEGRDGTADRRRHAVGLRDNRGGTREVAHPREHYAQLGEEQRQLRDGAGVTDELDQPCGDRVQPVEVPYNVVAGGHGHPAPTAGRPRTGCGRADPLRVARSRPRPRARRWSQSEAVEQQVEGAQGQPAAEAEPAAWRGRSPGGRPVRRHAPPSRPRPTRPGRSRARGLGRTARAVWPPRAEAKEHRRPGPRRRRPEPATGRPVRAGTHRAAGLPPWPPA